MNLLPRTPARRLLTIAAVAALATAGCGRSGEASAGLSAGASAQGAGGGGQAAPAGSPSAGATGGVTVPSPASPSPASPSASPSASASRAAADARTTFAPGNPAGKAAVPAAARAVNTSRPTRVIGKGTPASCTSAAVVAAVAKGGIIRFDCGPKPVTIKMTKTAVLYNKNPRVVLDGRGLVTLSGGGKRRILYMNTCDGKLGWTTSHCQNQATPRLTLQNLTFADGNSTGQKQDGGGGGAVFVRGGQVNVVNTTWLRNRCDTTGPDLGGAALRVLHQYQSRPVYVVNSTFGGSAGNGGVCSNGGALSSIQVSWTILNSVFSYNKAIGRGANPARGGTPGGGSGGAIYNDGLVMTLRIAGTVIRNNTANEGGGAIFFVSNDLTGTVRIENSTLRANPSKRFETKGFPGIFFMGKGKPVVSGSKISK